MRKAEIARKTNETDIKLTLELDGTGKSEISTGCGFLDHMLTLFARHGRFDMSVSCKGDRYVDFHHTVEDIGIVLGDAFRKALGDMRGIVRYGSMILPMDEALIMTAADISGRPHLSYGLDIPAQKVGEFDTELTEEFFLGFARGCPMALHFKKLYGENNHHVCECAFKAFAKVMALAVKIDPDRADKLPTTKGSL